MLSRLERVEAESRLAHTKRKHDFDWQVRNLTELMICEHESNKDYFDWKIKMLKQTQWLNNFKSWKEGDFYYARWFDTRKLRIYYNWMHRSGRKTYERVLKYMHSPLFASVLVMDRGALNPGNELLIDLGLNYGQSADLLKDWFKDIMDISAQVIKTPEVHYLSFDQTNSRKLLAKIKPIVQDIPSMHKKLYKTPYVLLSKNLI